MKVRRGWQWLSLIMLVFLLSIPIASAAKEDQRIPTTIIITPNVSRVECGNNITLTATLKDSEGNPLSGKTIVWVFTTTEYTFGTNIGSLRPSRGVTDSRGQATTIYTPAIQHEPYGVTIAASFGDFIDWVAVGDDFYKGSSADCHISVYPAAGDIWSPTARLLWFLIVMIVFLVGSAFIERRLTRNGGGIMPFGIFVLELGFLMGSGIFGDMISLISFILGFLAVCLFSAFRQSRKLAFFYGLNFGIGMIIGVLAFIAEEGCAGSGIVFAWIVLGTIGSIALGNVAVSQFEARKAYQQKTEAYRRKLRQWEAEGYEVEELKEKWGFK
jgi:hypothetical protein